ncbi:MAG: helix-turn-helix domain-containing protein [Ruminococcaceae bacterium]|nr:helix-turn-helix domain-containing protein [Oscillospiraceae bacterium]
MKKYLRHKSLNVVDVKELIALEYLDFEGKYKDYVEKHDFWEICFVERGKVDILLEEERQSLSAEDIIFIAPDTVHSYFSENGNKTRAFVVCFACSSQALKSLSGMRFSLDAIQLDCVKKIISEFPGTFRMNEDDVMEVLPSPSFGGQQAIILQLEYLLICLIRKLSVEKNPEIIFLNDDKFYAGVVDVLKTFLRENVNRKLTLAEICNKVNYSRSFLCKTFREQTGETLFAYFNRLKVAEAKRRLAKTQDSIGKISRALGFSEAKYFGAMFKTLVGVSPSAYRKKAKNT